MKRLGELLIEKGALDVSELRTALETCRRRGHRLGTELLRFGFVEEKALLEALSEQLAVPFISEALLAKSPWAVRQSAPLEVLQRLQAVPFERTQWRLRVAMANPRDPAGLEELANHAGVEIEPYVATEAAIRKTLKRLKEQEAQARERRQPGQPPPSQAPQTEPLVAQTQESAQPDPAPSHPARQAAASQPAQPTASSQPQPAQSSGVEGGVRGGGAGSVRGASSQPIPPSQAPPEQPIIPQIPDWDQLWQPSRIGPGELLRIRGNQRRGEVQPLLSTYPELAPVIEIPGISFEADLDDRLYLQRLKEAQSRDEVGALLVRYATRYLGRVCLFALHKDKVVGWMARGQGVVLDDVQSFAITLEESSLFLRAQQSGRYSLGAIPAEPANGRLINVLGEPPPLDVFLAPIAVAGRTVAFLLGDNPGEGGGGIATQELLLGTGKAAVALEILAMKSKLTL